MLGLFTDQGLRRAGQPDAAAAPQAAPDPARRGPDRGLARLQGRGRAVRLLPQGRAVRRLDRGPAPRGRRAARRSRAEQVRLLGRRDPDGRSASLIVALPRSRYDAELLARAARPAAASASAPPRVDSHLVLGEGDRVQVHFPVHASRRAARRSTSASSSARSPSSRAPGTTAARGCSSSATATSAGACWRRAGRARFPRSYKALDPAAAGGARHRLLRAAGDARRAVRRRAAERADQRGERTRIGLYKRGGKVELSAGDADARAPRAARHRGGPDAPAGRRRRDLGAGLRRARPGRPAARPRGLGDRVADSITAVWRGETSRTRSTGSCSRPGSTGARSRSCAPTACTASAIGSRFTEGYQNDVLAAQRGDHARARASSSSCASTPARARRGGRGGAARGDPRRPRRRRARSTTTASCATSSG